MCQAFWVHKLNPHNNPRNRMRNIGSRNVHDLHWLAQLVLRVTHVLPRIPLGAGDAWFIHSLKSSV